ncbi:hypothetical protein ElyMa_000794500 [Elysia marginata]|uniref:Uncharacterized protein n=1 Tax=Elysia marginata TaxID=1093978 RepID=A0AAV4GVM0_9GAST|nr:hypothetical protein ElyMa_000794500 [Elysia marginata]
MWHGHRCYVTRGMDENPLNGKPFDELDEKTGEITKYLREELKVNVVEMRECSWNNKKKEEHEVIKFVAENVPLHPTTLATTEKELIEAIKNNTIFGLVQCDVVVPQELEEKFSELQPIFKNTNVGIDDIGEHMKTFATENKLLKQPRKTLIGSFFWKKRYC